ncbi:hypothetical protein DIZ81_02170 [Legionella taurinensis]|uniref:Major outer membrane protein n=1 Tax=Legionella taurinensis TaxID=70611 RepID=A0A3A5L2Y9_9GAMM|nr:Lpg1974 family pore-forming outer membrane protein [Legionella taurinensis]MDX1836323.1 Lpg1974 family pore-forming outer membrane protein [Legionella taurinensis]PUT41925.1 hypothetical protein DB744_02175 [Legionella taurinensis]PUT44714.1 hypothetical protein DB746_02175 [Legionella taurinensis]PUT48034.1 hypothetical protein DB743_00335 [Legionella taurinensis]PUT48848.1 hypothetical protein DB745_02175 [Legionella taurinensis]
MFKRITLAILGMSISGFAAAGMYGAPPAPTCTPGDVTVPCEAKKWDLGIQALYLKPIYDADKAYGLAASSLSEYKDVDNEWGWGYKLEGSYHFRTGNDITVDWLHYDVDSNNGAFTGVFPSPLGGVVNANFTHTFTNKFDRVNAVMGQHVDMGMRKNARFYGGFQYADIRVNSNLAYSVVSPTILLLTSGVFGTQNTDFNGVGPVVGVDFSYDLTESFSITANTSGSILYGTGRYNEATFFGNNLVAFTRYGTQKSVVPSVEAKLGANYAYETANGTLNIEAGYQVFNYFNSLQHINPLCGCLRIDMSDFGMYGVYGGLKWVAAA